MCCCVIRKCQKCELVTYFLKYFRLDANLKLFNPLIFCLWNKDIRLSCCMRGFSSTTARPNPALVMTIPPMNFLSFTHSSISTDIDLCHPRVLGMNCHYNLKIVSFITNCSQIEDGNSIMMLKLLENCSTYIMCVPPLLDSKTFNDVPFHLFCFICLKYWVIFRSAQLPFSLPFSLTVQSSCSQSHHFFFNLSLSMFKIDSTFFLIMCSSLRHFVTLCTCVLCYDFVNKNGSFDHWTRT